MTAIVAVKNQRRQNERNSVLIQLKFGICNHNVNFEGSTRTVGLCQNPVTLRTFCEIITYLRIALIFLNSFDFGPKNVLKIFLNFSD